MKLEDEDAIPLERENEKYNKLDLLWERTNIFWKCVRTTNVFSPILENRIIKKWKEDGVVVDEED